MNPENNDMQHFTREALDELFREFHQKRVLVIGDVMVDAYLWGSVDRISPEAPVPVVAVTHRSSRLGGAANVALNVKALGAEAVLCSVVGNDVRGNEFIALMEAEGLDCGGIMQSESRITTTKFRIFGNRTQMLRVDEEVTDHLSAGDAEVFMEKLRKKLRGEKWDVVIFQDYDKGLITKELIAGVTSIAGELDIPVAVDPKRRHFTDYRNVTLFKPNLKEFVEAVMGGSSPGDESAFREAVERLQISQEIEIVMITLSSEGIFVSHEGQGLRMPAHVREVSDVSGAGDTVISVAALGLASGITPVQLAAIGNLAGGLVCEEVGVVPVNREKLLKEACRQLTDE